MLAVFAAWAAHSLPPIEGAATVAVVGRAFSVRAVVPAAVGLYTLRIFARLPAQAEPAPSAAAAAGDLNADQSDEPFLHAVDFLGVARENPIWDTIACRRHLTDIFCVLVRTVDLRAPPPFWRGCDGCAFPRVFSGESVAHTPRQRALAVGSEFNFVLELPGADTALVRLSADDGDVAGGGGGSAAAAADDVHLAVTTVGALLGAPRLSTRPAFAGSVRCRRPGNLTVYARRRGESAMRGMLQYVCAAGGHRPMPGGGVPPPSNVVAAAVGAGCPRLTCLPELIANMAFLTDTGDLIYFCSQFFPAGGVQWAVYIIHPDI